MRAAALMCLHPELKPEQIELSPDHLNLGGLQLKKEVSDAAPII